jgi:type III secretion protein D
MTGTLEWRVAAGPNQGASFSLGAGKAVVGSGDEADIILSGRDVKPAHLEITIQPGPGGAFSVKAAPLEGRIRIDGTVVDAKGAALSEGQILSLGFSAIVYKTEGADWGDVELVPLSFAKAGAEAPAPPSPEAPSVEGEAASGDVSEAKAEEGDLPEIVPDPPEGSSGEKSDGEKPRRATAATLKLILIALLLALLAFGPPAGDQGPDRLDGLRALLDANGFERLSVSERGGALEASGSLESDEELSRLVDLVKGQPAKVFLRISVRRDLLEAAREALASYGFYPAMTFGSDGRPIAAVYMRDREVEERAFAALSRDVPSLDPLRKVVHKGVMEPVLRQELTEAGLGVLVPEWGEGMVTLPVPSGFQGASALARAFQRAASRTGVPVVYALAYGDSADDSSRAAQTVFEAAAATPTADPAPPPGDLDNPMASLDVSGVTLSPMRFVSTRDGQRLFEGSPLPGGWTITAIEAESLTLSREEEAVVFELKQN